MERIDINPNHFCGIIGTLWSTVNHTDWKQFMSERQRVKLLVGEEKKTPLKALCTRLNSLVQQYHINVPNEIQQMDSEEVLQKLGRDSTRYGTEVDNIIKAKPELDKKKENNERDKDKQNDDQMNVDLTNNEKEREAPLTKKTSVDDEETQQRSTSDANYATFSKTLFTTNKQTTAAEKIFAHTPTHVNDSFNAVQQTYNDALSRERQRDFTFHNTVRQPSLATRNNFSGIRLSASEEKDLKDALKKQPENTVYNGETDVIEFFDHFERYFLRLHRLGDVALMFALQTSLTNDAFDTAKNINASSYDELRDALILEFAGEYYRKDLKRKAKRMRLYDGDDVRIFFRKFENMMLKAQPQISTRELIEAAKTTLCGSQRAFTAIAGLDVTSVSDLAIRIQFMIESSAIKLRSRDDYLTNFYAASTAQQAKEPNESKGKHLGTQDRYEQPCFKYNMSKCKSPCYFHRAHVCINCKGMHTVTDCKQKWNKFAYDFVKKHRLKGQRQRNDQNRKNGRQNDKANAKQQTKQVNAVEIENNKNCDHCGSDFHNVSECQIKNESFQAQQLHLSVVQTTIPSIEPIIVVNINNRPLVALVDTGAQLSIIDKKTANSVLRHYPITKVAIVVCGFTGEKYTCTEAIDAKLKYANRYFDIRLHLLPAHKRLAQRVILGFDFLQKHKLSVAHDKNSVILKQINAITEVSQTADQPLRELGKGVQLSKKPKSDDCNDGENYEMQLEKKFSNFKLPGDSDEKFSFGQQLTNEQQRQLKRLIEKFPTLVATKNTKLGCSTKYKHEITLKTDKPITQRAKSMSAREDKALKQMIDENLQNGSIVESNSPYSSRPVFIVKTDGSIRVCNDFRILNANTVKQDWPLPLLQDALDRWPKASYFSTLDL